MWIIILFVVCVGGCWLIARAIGEALFGKSEKRNVFIDKSVHHHYHEHKNISIIDDATKKKIFELKDKN